MAIFYLQTAPLSRRVGRTATAAAAYRAGERIRDEASGRVYNHTGRRDVVHTQILLPPGTHPDWAQDRAQLWNQAERAEHRGDARVAREYQVALPAELNAGQQLQLARAFAREISDRHGVAVDLAVHEPRAGGDPRNHHAHLLASTRELGATGFGAKAGLEMRSAARAERGLPRSGIEEITALRQRWATLANEALREAGQTARIDHRTLQAQGIDREPLPHIPWVAQQRERRGLRSEVAERIRAAYAARVETRRERALQGILQGPDLETMRRQAREQWAQLQAHTGTGRDAATPAASMERDAQHDAAMPADRGLDR